MRLHTEPDAVRFVAGCREKCTFRWKTEFLRQRRSKLLLITGSVWSLIHSKSFDLDISSFNLQLSLLLFSWVCIGWRSWEAERDRRLASDYFIQKRKMVVLCVSQCDRHGRGRRSWSPLLHGPARMVHDFHIIYIYIDIFFHNLCNFWAQTQYLHKTSLHLHLILSLYMTIDHQLVWNLKEICVHFLFFIPIYITKCLKCYMILLYMSGVRAWQYWYYLG